MARLIEGARREFDLGDIVEFDHEGKTYRGVVVRVYNARYDYHVEVNGRRWSVCLDDNMRLAPRRY